MKTTTLSSILSGSGLMMHVGIIQAKIEYGQIVILFKRKKSIIKFSCLLLFVFVILSIF